jgi:hypothetical protein
MREIIWILLVPLGWGAAALLFRRVRRGTRGFAEGGTLKARMPAWLKTFETVVLAAFWLLASAGLFSLFTALHHSLHPGLTPNEGGELARILILTGSFMAALPPSMLAANLVSWVVPPLRRANEVAMTDLPTTTFAAANKGLALLGALVVPVALIQGLLGVSGFAP